LSFLITPILSSLNRKIFNGLSSQSEICAYLCDKAGQMSIQAQAYQRHELVCLGQVLSKIRRLV